MALGVAEYREALDLGTVGETWRQRGHLSVDETFLAAPARDLVAIGFRAHDPGTGVHHSAAADDQAVEIAAIRLKAPVRRSEIARHAIIVDPLPRKIDVPVEAKRAIPVGELAVHEDTSVGFEQELRG